MPGSGFYASCADREALKSRKRTLCGTEMAVEWGFHAFQPMIAHPKISAYGRRTHASEMPGGFLRADFGVPRMRVSVFSVVDTLRKSLTPRLGRGREGWQPASLRRLGRFRHGHPLRHPCRYMHYIGLPFRGSP